MKFDWDKIYLTSQWQPGLFSIAPGVNKDGKSLCFGVNIRYIIQARPIGLELLTDDEYNDYKSHRAKHHSFSKTFPRHNMAFVSKHIIDGCKMWHDSGSFGGMSLCEFIRKMYGEPIKEFDKMSVDVITALETIEYAAIGNERFNAIKAVDSPDLRKLLYFALSPDVTFGVKQLPAPYVQTNPFSDASKWFKALTDLLVLLMEDDTGKRHLTGTEAKAAIAEFLAACTDVQRKWAERVLVQDLRLNIGAKDVNKLLGKNTIPLFAVPLALPFKDLKSTNGTWALQPKMDGGRCVARLEPHGGKVTLLSRTGKEWPGFEDIKESLAVFNRRLDNDETMMLDGEVVLLINGRMDFQAIQKLFLTKDGRRPDKGELRFVAFDYATEEEYENPTMTYGQRYKQLGHLFLRSDIKFPSNIGVIDTDIITNPTNDQLFTTANKFVSELGCDGAIMRRLDAVIRNKKTTDITKVKPFLDGEAVVIGKVEGKGQLVGSTGTIVCRLVDKKKRPVGPEFEIGTGEGLTHKLRQEIWDDPDLIGKFVNFKYQKLSNDGVPVLPTFRSFRHPDDF